MAENDVDMLDVCDNSDPALAASRAPHYPQWTSPSPHGRGDMTYSSGTSGEPVIVTQPHSCPSSHTQRTVLTDKQKNLYLTDDESEEGLDTPPQDLNQAKVEERKQPSASPDEATVYVTVKWPRKDLPPKWESTLEKTLQSWLNKDFGDKTTDCTLKGLYYNGSWAEVKITPSTDLKVLLNQRATQMTFKDQAKTTATVQFHKTAPSTSWNQSDFKPSSMDGSPPTSHTPQDVKLPMTVRTIIDLSGIPHEAQVALQTRFSQYHTYHSLTFTGNFEEVEKFQRKVNKVIKEAEARPAGDWNGLAATPSMTHKGMNTHEAPGQTEMSFPVPLTLFGYINQAYQKEMEDIQKRNGVKINADVKVSIKEDSEKTGRDCLLPKAYQELIDLFQKCAGDFHSNSAHLPHMNLEDLQNTLKNIQNEESRLVLNVSANSCNVFGPKQSMVAVRKAFGVGHSSTVKTFGMDHSSTDEAFGSGRRSTEIPQKIVLDIKDPLVSSGLSMDPAHWEMIQKIFDEQIKAIQNKFGVVFMNNPSQGKVRVTTRPIKSQHTASLESHAIRALMHLYQKVATSTMSCYLLDTTQAGTVGDMLEKIRSRHQCVGAGEKYGPWRLIGLPEHLGPAVKELEEKLGGPVFKEEDKQRIVYPEDFNTGAAEVGAAGEATCPICMDIFTNKEKLSCTHEFCKECLRRSVESMGPSCPVCKDVYGKVEGDQPDGTMTHTISYTNLPGFTQCDTIVINYDIPDGKQTRKHPNPGKHFYGTQRRAYLPNNIEGNEVLKLLKKAFNQRLIFTVGISRTTGAENVVTWNDIHHKTNIGGGAQSFGYPDHDYLSRVKDELKAKGIK
ncbi:E3 ubiquitin-protein ligase DTX3L isoform X1 [Oncorhynchus mykiss]|uniref:E3 ubiquitin-protein ligase n=1 Tax=Oncorhynchus mykiss TaxID=8022 RepID=A0A8C7V5B4_ONCMY|nr:E3 ubiquitin-protein ligase DTX3L isoform X1 [Oncorhynchus mykiss]XP_021465727.2 E3 ubiquitin-protein ligase DTX3L isoform X1 [Oncorhynchus mykiss]XP_036839630.1 E3 ubiquitin-protein ligase DTX3L isoform X1 [Oncorhynchus mykiss]XP_036839631.1 E3 ubiquitin-protein ligase DTX3L isoform X1 [Oncorhynchus mykiss]